MDLGPPASQVIAPSVPASPVRNEPKPGWPAGWFVHRPDGWPAGWAVRYCPATEDNDPLAGPINGEGGQPQVRVPTSFDFISSHTFFDSG